MDKRDGSVGKSSKMGTSKRDALSKMSELKEIEEAVETLDGVLVRATRDRSVSMGDDAVVGVGAPREGEGTVGGPVGDKDGVGDAEIDTVGVTELEDGDE